MIDQLNNHVDLLFSGVEGAEDMKEEILQNTIERYNDLIAQGKSPQSAYQLAISGIGDISEILGEESGDIPREEHKPEGKVLSVGKRILRAIAVCLYILCPIPLFALQNEFGLCGLLGIVAVATALMVISGTKTKEEIREKADKDEKKTTDPARKAADSIVWIAGLCIYFALSFLTSAWHITWIMFPLIAAIQGLIEACFDLKGGDDHAN
jgi:hypothetical protein